MKYFTLKDVISDLCAWDIIEGCLIAVTVACIFLICIGV